MAGHVEGDSWEKTVLRSMPSPAWLSLDGPESDVVVSARVRYARNLEGCRFPRTATSAELLSVKTRVEKAAGSGYTLHRRLSEAERDYLLGCRMISPDFQYQEPGRLLLIDSPRVVSVMVNEEDHLRLQALTPGLSLDEAEAQAQNSLARFAERLDFVNDPTWGWLTASPINAGEAHRRSVLVHLPALGFKGEIDRVRDALTALGVAVRGVFGEASHPIGEFRQISLTKGSMSDFRGACRYIVEKEREARASVSASVLDKVAKESRIRLISSQEVTSADAIRELSIQRWSRAMEPSPARVREIDNWISALELQGTPDAKTAARYRAVSLRAKLEQA